MAKLLKLRRGTTTQHASFTGAEGEVTIDTDKDTAVVHDGSTQAGRPLAREDMTNVSSASIAGRLGTDSITPAKIAAGALPTDVTVADANISGNLTIESADIVDGTIVNADINASAAIANSKLADSGVTAGSVGTATAVPVITTNAKGIVTGTSTTDLNQIKNGTSQLDIVNNSSLSGKVAGTERLSIKSTGIDVNGKVVVSDRYSLDTHGDLRTKTGATNAVVSGLTGHVLQNSVVLDSDQDIWLQSAGKKITFGTSDSATHEVMRVQCAAVGASQHGFVNLNYVTANAGGNASSATKLVTTTGGVTVTGQVAVTGTGISFSAEDSGKAAFGTGDDLQIWHTGSHGYLKNTTNYTYHQATQHHFENAAGNQVQAKFIENGACELNHSGSTKLATSSTGVSVTGALVASGDVTAFSDARLKTDIHTINDALGTVGKLRGVNYKWLKDGKQSTGLIAQEVEAVIPEVVTTNEELTVDGVKEVKSIDYGKLVGVLIEAVKELKAELDEHKAGGK